MLYFETKCVWIRKVFFKSIIQRQIQDFPGEMGQSIIWQHFGNCMKMKEFGLTGGAFLEPLDRPLLF